MTDAEYMKTIRKKLDLTQSEMAEKLGYSGNDAISKVERGEKGMSGVARKLLTLIEKYEL